MLETDLVPVTVGARGGIGVEELRIGQAVLGLLRPPDDRVAGAARAGVVAEADQPLWRVARMCYRVITTNCISIDPQPLNVLSSGCRGRLAARRSRNVATVPALDVSHYEGGERRCLRHAAPLPAVT